MEPKSPVSALRLRAGCGRVAPTPNPGGSPGIEGLGDCHAARKPRKSLGRCNFCLFAAWSGCVLVGMGYGVRCGETADAQSVDALPANAGLVTLPPVKAHGCRGGGRR